MSLQKSWLEKSGLWGFDSANFYCTSIVRLRGDGVCTWAPYPSAANRIIARSTPHNPFSYKVMKASTIEENVRYSVKKTIRFGVYYTVKSASHHLSKSLNRSDVHVAQPLAPKSTESTANRV